MRKEHIITLGSIALIIGICIMAIVFLPQGTTEDKTSGNGSFSDLSPSSRGEVLGGSSASPIVLDTPITKGPDRVMVFRTMPAVVSKADAVELAKKFGVTDINEPKEGDAVISVTSKDMRYYIMIYKNGGRLYEDNERVDTPNGIDILENLPSDDDAVKIATAFLTERDLLPEEAVFRKSKHTMAYKVNRSGGEPTVVYEKITLGFSRELNGLNIEGTQFMVDVGGYGDIISYFVNWKEYEPIGEYPVKSGETAFTELKQNGVNVGSGPEKPDKISIDQAYLAYYTKALAYPEEYLEPVWVFKGTASVNGKTITPVTEYIPALTDEAVKSLSST